MISDRWREAELREKLDAAGVPPAELVRRGQGFKDGSEDLRAFTAGCLDGKVRPVMSCCCGLRWQRRGRE